MQAAPDSPQAAFAEFVRRAVDAARRERGWTVSDLAARSGVGVGGHQKFLVDGQLQV